MSLHLHFEPVMYVGRGYAHPDGFKHHHAYELVFSVFMLGDGRARVFATHGELTRATVATMAEQLEAMGVHTVLVDRHGVEQEWRVRRGCEKASKTARKPEPLQ